MDFVSQVKNENVSDPHFVCSNTYLQVHSEIIDIKLESWDKHFDMILP